MTRLIALLVLTLSLTACGGPAKEQPEAESTPPPPADPAREMQHEGPVDVPPSITESPRPDAARVRIGGSDLTGPLLRRWAELYAQGNLDVSLPLSQDVSLPVSAVSEGTIDLLGTISGQATEGLTEQPIAVSGLAVFVHPDNPLEEITMAQIAALFGAPLPDFELIGSSGKATCYLPSAGSDTDLAFQMLFPDLAAPSSLKREFSSSAVAAAVAADPSGIGIAALPTCWNHQGVKLLAVQDSARAEAVHPVGTDGRLNGEALRSKRYPLAVRCVLLARSEDNPALKGFLNWCLEPQAQTAASEEGYTPLRPVSTQ